MFRYTLFLTVLWAVMAVAAFPDQSDFFYFRHQLIMLTGIIGFGYMAAAMALAVRSRWLEARIKGLDRMYRYHKHLGIGATVALVLHWLSVEGAKWLVMAGVVSRPNRGSRLIEGFNWRGFAEGVGEWVFYGFLVFAVVSLLERISYGRFRAVHKAGSILFIGAVLHSVILVDSGVMAIPYNMAVYVMSAIGLIAALISLTGRIGRSKKMAGSISWVMPLAGKTDKPEALHFEIDLKGNLDVKPGQFAFVNFHDGESPHPFSVLHYDSQQHRIQFGVKALGDYTSKLVKSMKAGQRVTVEGGYGHFTPSDCFHQIWVGAGIGIVPFIAWLYAEKMLNSVKNRQITLYYCVPSRAQAYFLGIVTRLSRELDHVELVVVDDGLQQRLSSDNISQAVVDHDYEISFCGPEGFAKALRSETALLPNPPQAFRNELFKMR
ncbi:ferric reductase-like transmembrane domain-containing protein [Parasalinivibrio latis]|uniref:ferredoxin reductase family protein n=1 Tax=Parasalinivibrio latis TaxID=2952610 RepID=UPI0030E0F5EF